MINKFSIAEIWEELTHSSARKVKLLDLLLKSGCAAKEQRCEDPKILDPDRASRLGINQYKADKTSIRLHRPPVSPQDTREKMDIVNTGASRPRPPGRIYISLRDLEISSHSRTLAESSTFVVYIFIKRQCQCSQGRPEVHLFTSEVAL